MKPSDQQPQEPTPANPEWLASQRAYQAAWGENVIARYLTVGGALVDVEEQRDGWKSPHWFCRGCTSTSRGAYTGPFGDPFTLTDIREQAQAHAEKCRALPRPALQ